MANNDYIRLWFDENCEYGDYKCSKQEIEESIGKKLSEFQGDLQRITGIKYDKTLKKQKQRGGWSGFRIIVHPDEDIEEVEMT